MCCAYVYVESINAASVQYQVLLQYTFATYLFNLALYCAPSWHNKYQKVNAETAAQLQ